MTEPLFLADLDDPHPGDQVLVTGEEGRHAVTVRRIRPGEVVLVADGAGTAVRGPVLVADRSGLVVSVTDVQHAVTRPVRYVAIQALPKGERAEQAVEMLTELGIDEIVPWQASRSVVRWAPDRVERALGRWRATAREAAKQSRRFRVPLVSPPLTTAEVAARIGESALTAVLHERAAEPISAITVPDAGEVLIVIGPEGGLADDEVATFVAAGGRAVLIADAVLRTSTAGVVALGQLLALSGRIGG